MIDHDSDGPSHPFGVPDHAYVNTWAATFPVDLADDAAHAYASFWSITGPVDLTDDDADGPDDAGGDLEDGAGQDQETGVDDDPEDDG